MKLSRMLTRAITLAREMRAPRDFDAELQEHLRERDRVRGILEAMAAGTWKPTAAEQAAIDARRRLTPMTPEYQRIRGLLCKMAGERPEGGFAP
jgi:hypothetical protein